ncbi:MipA/OmpV family protein [Parvularcula marina]|uniref:MipA/OmpV family protein n=1 Tax=Parvularcula marina TaxID=2292771 RepID=UPI00351854E6
MTHFRAGALLAALSGLMISPAFAQEETPTRAIGAGVGIVSEPYAELEDDYRLFPVPLLYLDGGRISVSGTSASLMVFKSDRWEAAATAEYRFNGYEADDSPVFEGMDDRSGTLEAGGWIAYNIDETVYLTGYAVHDVLDEHGGFELRGQAAWSWNPHVATNVTPFLGVAFRSEELSDYYYGVLPGEAMTITNFNGGTGTFVRNAYAPGETLTPYAGISVRQALSSSWAVFFSARHEFLPDEVEDSPLVDDDGRSYAGLALGRLF